ncbi:MAG: putative undecaprenyl-phosphate N-acetylglucosaminyl 1-phosphate transferase [Planctomycetota bacterium]
MNPEAINAIMCMGLIALGVSVVLNWIAIWLAPKLGLMDAPSERKVHAVSIPRMGGLCIWFSMILVAGFSWVAGSSWWLDGDIPGWVYTGLILLILVGVLDDRIGMPWQPRLLVHFLAGALAVWGLGFFNDMLVGVTALIFLVAMTNAFNMIDNMDWQCGGVSLLSLLAVLFLQFQYGHASAATLNLLALGALSGFLWWNRPVAKIFLGDAGSIPLGFLIATMTLALLKNEILAEPVTIMGISGIFLIPIYDLITVVAIRLIQGKSPFHADKQHLSHRMVQAGSSSRKAVLTILLIHLSGVMSGVVLIVCNRIVIAWIIFGWMIVSCACLCWLDFRAFTKSGSIRARG